MTPESVPFADEHKARLASFQSGDERFVWGVRTDTGAPWFLSEDTAHESRAFVKEFVVCPVPGCRAQLTTAHRAKKRDGLQHMSDGGGHSRESIFHSQGCALVEEWLRREFPNSHVLREEYTNELGERRADVLLTGPAGDRVAFEIQYSPITPDAWRNRHESYRRQHIADVWLFGHTGKQLQLRPDGTVSVNPTHEVVVELGSALMFINPEQELIAVAVGRGRVFKAALDGYGDEEVQVCDVLDAAILELRPLAEFRPTNGRGLGGNWLDGLYTRSDNLRRHNESERARAVEQRERAAREWERIRLEKIARQTKWEERRRPEQEKIRSLFSSVERWGRSEALASITSYFGDFLRDRIEMNENPTAPSVRLIRWQCVVYFDLIAGRDKEFGTRDAYNAIIRRGVNMGQPDAFKQIASYLYRLEEDGYVRRLPDYRRDSFPRFIPTTSGAWW
ncbi:MULTISPECIES: competence protein CoiA family protein [unclassified Cryobacterium]|uniref:competence protein CoiA family protein n=1 Tax=unclassified Cryobacterium TaxID=2649013 RepID=UPI002AB3F06C|nr:MULTISPECIES: competence protein CoiA family protein [unclassified Cryobacterium]MDY7543363.1 competence protein CoiA family protein [Cryobacterium sp. 5B3]MEB0000410.1 competence protein CoiA family protein [Cryobacterium sp. RTS3]MEB0276114.1 competence protein CoiA family protein [Cryobacterium sp. 5B3]